MKTWIKQRVTRWRLRKVIRVRRTDPPEIIVNGGCGLLTWADLHNALVAMGYGNLIQRPVWRPTHAE